MILKRRLSDAASAVASTGKKQRSLTEFFNISKPKVVCSSPKQSDSAVHTDTSIKTSNKEDSHDSKEQLGGAEVESGSHVKFIGDFKSKLTPEQVSLLSLELETLEPSWLVRLHKELTMHYFLQLKRFIAAEQSQYQVFPPPEDIYSWSRLSPFEKVRVVVIGQDPYHNFNQAHGLAFSVKRPTPAPPSLQNIYKELKNNYSDFEVDTKIGDLSHWSEQGVLLLNTSLTVRAHNANSHSKKGWLPFTTRVIQLLVEDRKRTKQPLVFLLWGGNAMKLGERVLGNKVPDNLLVLKSVHPSPLSASRGFFGNNQFRKINDWLYSKKHPMIDWSVVPGTMLKEVTEANRRLQETPKD
ncbi:HFL226Cp [Eremothecium sinecaudum]|uniref:Uracil-DNA glycosylase n=1 Tax=Eremothecium sinecaudum TaxID=45286 RepID=A0A120K2I4_9SACH|nr:HFL226Cp [Eremothecium sinecaudum]AMD21630.1 HFL226Cp [Eremothecium sinecaudum]